MINEYIETPLEVGTVLKETYGKNNVEYYIVGDFFIYENDYDFFQIRPYKFIFDEHITIASEDEKQAFIEDLKKNHLIWDEKTGKVIREYEEFNLNVKVQAEEGIDIQDLIKRLNSMDIFCPGVKKIVFNDF